MAATGAKFVVFRKSRLKCGPAKFLPRTVFLIRVVLKTISRAPGLPASLNMAAASSIVFLCVLGVSAVKGALTRKDIGDVLGPFTAETPRTQRKNSGPMSAIIRF
jgi:hypothetical protein